MKRFNEFIRESLIIEMPHMEVGDDLLDLELEVHSNMRPDEYLKYFQSILQGKQIESKNPGHTFKLHKRNTKRFAQEILDNTFVIQFTEKHYGVKIRRKLEKMMKGAL